MQMRNLIISVILAACAAMACARADTSPGMSLPISEPVTRFSDKDLGLWSRRKVDGKDSLVSPVLDFAGYEVNHHRVTVTYSGKGTVEVSVAHSTKADLDAAIEKPYLHSRFQAVQSGKEIMVSSPYKAERYAWIIVRPTGAVRISAIQHKCWRGRGTQYGHFPGAFKFGGAKLPYRLMFPRNYDPAKAYPLVLSVHSSGGMGMNNNRNMEMVILGRYLFTKYYYDDRFECFSLVPQILPQKAIPSPFWPKGPSGKPTPIYHPDWPDVNENGWYNEATLALIRALIKDKSLNIDPDRVYYSGFSYGGKGCWEFLKSGRDVFAAAMGGGGWPIGRAYSNPSGPLLERLKLEAERYRHIPVFIFAGEKDPMRYGSAAANKMILSLGGKSTYAEFPRAGHVQSAGIAWGNRRRVAWLFKQNRRNNPPAGKDPFPRGIYP